jgi:hypothetical protein
VDHPPCDLPFQNTVIEPGSGSRKASEALKHAQEKFRRILLLDKNQGDGLRVRIMVSPYLGIPRIEDRRYDVVIDFHSATPFALSRYAYLRLKPWSFPTARVVFRSPTFNHDCIETDLFKNYLHLFLAMMGSIWTRVALSLHIGGSNSF